VGHLEPFAPRLAGVDALADLARREFLAEEAVDRSHEVREAVHVVRLLDDRAIDHRRELHFLGVVVTGEREDLRVEAVQDVLEHRAAAEDALHADGNDEAVLDEAFVERDRFETRCRHLNRP
jgi:hypothetical protein